MRGEVGNKTKGGREWGRKSRKLEDSEGRGLKHRAAIEEQLDVPIVSYWLYYGKRVLTAVRLPEGTSDQDVRRKAIDDEERCPLGHLSGREAPIEFRTKLHNSTIRRFDIPV